MDGWVAGRMGGWLAGPLWLHAPPEASTFRAGVSRFLLRRVFFTTVNCIQFQAWAQAFTGGQRGGPME